MDKKTAINILIKEFRKELTALSACLKNVLKKGKINKNKIKKVSFRSETINYYLGSIEKKYNKKAVLSLTDSIANKCVLPCVFYQTDMNSNKLLGKESIKDAIECIKIVEEEIEKIKEHIADN